MDLHLEGAPTDDQKERLEDYLTELTLLARKYRMMLLDPDHAVEIHDLDSGRVVGLGIAVFTQHTNPRKVGSYVPVDSILDGVWPVDTPYGIADQWTVQNIFPLRDQ